MRPLLRRVLPETPTILRAPCVRCPEIRVSSALGRTTGSIREWVALQRPGGGGRGCPSTNRTVHSRPVAPQRNHHHAIPPVHQHGVRYLRTPELGMVSVFIFARCASGQLPRPERKDLVPQAAASGSTRWSPTPVKLTTQAHASCGSHVPAAVNGQPGPRPSAAPAPEPWPASRTCAGGPRARHRFTVPACASSVANPDHFTDHFTSAGEPADWPGQNSS